MTKKKKSKISEFRKAYILFQASNDRYKAAIENEDYDNADKEEGIRSVHLGNVIACSARPFFLTLIFAVFMFVTFFGLLVWCAVFK